MSSAYEWYDKLKQRIMPETGLMYIQYKAGRSTDPWGTSSYVIVFLWHHASLYSKFSRHADVYFK